MAFLEFCFGILGILEIFFPFYLFISFIPSHFPGSASSGAFCVVWMAKERVQMKKRSMLFSPALVSGNKAGKLKDGAAETLRNAGGTISKCRGRDGEREREKRRDRGSERGKREEKRKRRE